MNNNSQKNTITVSVRNLVEFILRSGDIDNRKKSGQDVQLMLEGARIHRAIQGRMGSDYHSEVYLKKEIALDGYDILIEGRADGIIYTEESLAAFSRVRPAAEEENAVKAGDKEPAHQIVIDEIKTMYLDLNRLNAPVPVHIAQAKCYAYIFAEQNELKEITVRMTYVNQTTLETRYFHETYTWTEIRNWFDDLIESYKRWARFQFEFRGIRNDSIHKVDFPFEYREGQKELVSQVYRTIYHGRKLFLEAPTGTGKTVSTVFPALKAIGEGLSDKIFYLTAKTITRTVAAECFDILREQGLRLKSVVITAKDKICMLDKPECNPESCERAGGHFDRVNDAMYDLLTHEDSFTREKIEEYADKHCVCPFEMCLDMSLFSDAVICDYNYVFDPNVYLRRFFADGAAGRYIFLVDEAHNLVDRGMDMYSAQLYKEEFLKIKQLLKEDPFSGSDDGTPLIADGKASGSRKRRAAGLRSECIDPMLDRALGGCNRKLLTIKRECEDYMVLEDISEFIMALNRLMSRLETFFDEQEHFKGKDEVLDFYFKVRHFLNMYDNMGEDDYRIYCEHTYDGDFMLKLLCVNPSDSIKLRLTKGQSTIFFSATLLPVQYYKDMLGAVPGDYAVYAHSVFDERKRGLFIASDVSSKYTRRNETEYNRIASYVADIVSGKEGNYMVFFPSHAFLNEVIRAYEMNYQDEDVTILVQKPVMSEEEREEFLLNFMKEKGDNKDKLLLPGDGPGGKAGGTIVGFCVLGGIFAEGIDLKNDSLIGAIIVGTGLPMVSNEKRILKDAYSDAGLDGFDYAYRYPGMNKVMQAAGRVIRTVDDVGIVALLDERFLLPEYSRLFPREWKRHERMTLSTAAEKVSEFWELF